MACAGATTLGLGSLGDALRGARAWLVCVDKSAMAATAKDIEEERRKGGITLCMGFSEWNGCCKNVRNSGVLYTLIGFSSAV
jgi:hypothetical protein